MTKAWLAALIRRSPIAAAPAVVSAGVVRSGPELVRALLDAVDSDAAFARLQPRGDLARLAASAGEMVGALDPAAAEVALHTLGSVAWEAVVDRPTLTLAQRATRADRLARVMAVLSSAVLQSIGDADWPKPLEQAIAAAYTARQPLALLSVELVDGRLIEYASAEEGENERLTAFRHAVRQAAGHDCLLVRDGAARVWLIVSGHESAQAVITAHACARAVRELPPWRHAPLAACIGVAALGRDGHTAPELIRAAESARFAAAAAGQEVCMGRPPGDEHREPGPSAFPDAYQ
ncbi:MAG TPA: hypothetical protein VFN48_00940 [Solirubrobacteraceae bacterium]|nr:hypothetical protein [Solirubrobacteraceae bacterium]